MIYEFLISGIVFGLTAGLVPGPLQALIISQTLKHNIKQGFLVALAPVFTDAPIILVSVLVLSKLANVDLFMAMLSFAGAAFIAYLAYGNLKITGNTVAQGKRAAGSVKKGIITNLLNPHPYMFWLLVGAPTILHACQANIIYAGVFLISIYLFLVGTFIAIAVLAHNSRNLLKGKGYLYVMKGLGVLLLIFSVRLIWEGVKYLGIL